jgi:diguanylate cyclase (GGDEF)-like protein
VSGLVAVAGTTGTGLLDEPAARITDGLAQLGAGAAAATACWWMWRRAETPDRRWRLLLFLGLAGWTAGAALSAWHQLLRPQGLSSPSTADLGFFLLPLLAIPALWSWPTDAQDGSEPVTHQSRSVLVLDGLMVVGSLFVLTWATTLGTALHSGGADQARLLVAIGRPAGDVLLVVLVALFAIFRRPANAPALLLFGLGLVCLAASDSLALYLVSTGGERMTPLQDLGFVAGPLLVLLAVLEPRPTPGRRGEDTVNGISDWAVIVLPYLPLVGTGLVVSGQLVSGRQPGPVETYAGLAVLVLVVLRQFVTLVDHLRLLRQIRQGREHLRRQVFNDSLTGLANRALFHDRIDHATQLQRRDLRPLSLLFCDLDDFKQINDTFGHAAGDELLRQVAARLRQCVQPADTVARLGGDEFAILLEHAAEPPEAVGERLLAALAEPFRLIRAGLPPATVYVGASVGLVRVEPGEGALSSDVLLGRADAAMYRAKKQGKGRLIGFSADEQEDGTTTERLADRLRAALSRPGENPDRDELDVVYQPIVRLASTEVVAVEALARWRHPQDGALPTHELIAEAERAGVLERLERQVLERACRDVARLRAGRASTLAVHVNLSAERVGDPALVHTVTELLTRHRLPGAALVLEITETRRVPDLAIAREVLGRLRAIGVRMALDDFGAGSGGMPYLLGLPVDIVKLDRALAVSTGEAWRDHRARELTRAATAMSHGMGLEVVAEGVETAEQMRRLVGLGCEYGQGYFFARPGALGDLGPAMPVTAPPVPRTGGTVKAG